ncbi:hypothetical protein GQ607_017678 [Colletotrichum asianum]|uniref:Uncharacterized protein n=1 Tax=Colletotrichum asianum TaxID=702518 RepID=A0A8H3VX41_9PEZI|nr:hypothetical protein GQ607_017678 [Colletotrichum asianum]
MPILQKHEKPSQHRLQALGNLRIENTNPAFHHPSHLYFSNHIMPSPQTRRRGRTDDVHPTTPDGTARQPQPTGLPPPNAGNPISKAHPEHVQDPRYLDWKQEKLRLMQCRSAALRASIIRTPISPSGSHRPLARAAEGNRATHKCTARKDKGNSGPKPILRNARSCQPRTDALRWGCGSSSPPPRSLLSWPTYACIGALFMAKG